MRRNFLVFFSIVAACFHRPVHSLAQLVNCNGFLKGNYVEAGLNWNGAFGSSTPPPAGYHPQTSATIYNSPTCGGASSTNTLLGFVADPDKDGWATGTPPLVGDYVLSGANQEGWSYFADGVQYNFWNHDALSSDTLFGGATAYLMNYSDTLGVKSVTAQGLVNGMYITQIFSLDTSKLFINCHVIIENTSLSSASGVMFMRTITPHDDLATSGSANNISKIEYNLPDRLFRTVISTRGTSNYSAYLSLGTQDDRAIGFITKASALPNSTTIDNIYSGDAAYDYTLHDSITGSDAIGLIFLIGVMPSGAEADFNYIYAFSSSVIDSSLNKIDSHVAVPNVDLRAIHIFPNPAHDWFTVSGLGADDNVLITDVLGRTTVLEKGSRPAVARYSTSSFPSGTYCVTVLDKAGVLVKRQLLTKY